jgi:hypothetical protein
MKRSCHAGGSGQREKKVPFSAVLPEEVLLENPEQFRELLLRGLSDALGDSLPKAQEGVRHALHDGLEGAGLPAERRGDAGVA